ncbi:MAG: glycosyltransferase, partial [Lachnospiraceae bacterium]|nr:glycosyltransferase [Lachnospiraceae bacterium]
IIGKKEEKNIEKCLEPLTHYPFEIIYVDTGSTDATKELATKYTDKIYDFEWIGDFSAARNFSLSKASHNYVLVLDCDEYLTELDLEGLNEAIESHPRSSVGQILRKSFSDSQYRKEYSLERIAGLFHKRNFHYIYLIHEQVADIRTDRTDYERYEIPVYADHVGYVGTSDEKRLKAERNNALLFKEIEQNPEEPYFYFQVAQSYNLIDDYENAYTYYKKAFELPLNLDNLWVHEMSNNFINVMVQTGRAAEALALYTPVYDDYADSMRFLCSMGSLYLNQATPQPLKAMMEYVKALQCTPESEAEDFSGLALFGMGFANELLGNLPAAASFYEKSAAKGYPLALEKLSAQ